MLFGVLLYIYGLLVSSVLFFTLYWVAYFVLLQLGYEMVTGLDAMAVIDPYVHNVKNCGGYFITGRLKASDLRDKYFLNKGVKKFKRLRQVWVKRFGLWLLKEVDEQLAIGQVKVIKEDIKTKEDIQAYMAKILAKKMDINKPLWEIHVKEDFDEETSIVFLTVHHLISDGMGMMGLITFLNDKHNPDTIIQFRRIPFFYRYIYPCLWIPFGIIEYVLK